jgi:hypothetical protein
MLNQLAAMQAVPDLYPAANEAVHRGEINETSWTAGRKVLRDPWSEISETYAKIWICQFPVYEKWLYI